MTGVVFRETIRRSWKVSLILGISMAAMALYMIVIFGDSKLLEQFQGIINNTSLSFLVNALGGGDAAFMATPEGMLNYGYFSWMVLLLAGYAVFAGLSVTANEEERGIMDALMSAPVPRWKVVIEKLLAFTVVIIIANLIGLVTLWVGVANSKTFTITLPRLVEGVFNMMPITLVVLCFTAFVGTTIRRRNTAGMVAAVFVVASFFVDMISRAAQAGDALRTISIFRYYDSVTVIKSGLVWGNVIILCVVAALLFAGSLWAFQRRDLGV